MPISDQPALEVIPWYANRGIPIGIIVYLVVLTIGATAYITNLADRLAFLESYGPSQVIQDNIRQHAETTGRLTLIETRLLEIQKQLDLLEKK